MPASEETYRRQPTLHLVFAISSVAMLLSTVWMVMADHLRPWKEVQRKFQSVERDKLEAAEKEKLEEQKQKYQTQLDDIDAKIQAAEADADTRARDIRFGCTPHIRRGGRGWSADSMARPGTACRSSSCHSE